MKDNLITDLLFSLSFSLFGLLLIFGLGFVFPLIDPYTAIKWIVIVCFAVFFYSFISYFMSMIADGKSRMSAVSAVNKIVKKSKKAKKASRK